MVGNKSLLNNQIKNCSHLSVERDNQTVLRVFSQLGHEPQTSDVVVVIDAIILLKHDFTLLPNNDLIKKHGVHLDMHIQP